MGRLHWYKQIKPSRMQSTSRHAQRPLKAAGRPRFLSALSGHEATQCLVEKAVLLSGTYLSRWFNVRSHVRRKKKKKKKKKSTVSGLVSKFKMTHQWQWLRSGCIATGRLLVPSPRARPKCRSFPEQGTKPQLLPTSWLLVYGWIWGNIVQCYIDIYQLQTDLGMKTTIKHKHTHTQTSEQGVNLTLKWDMVQYTV